MNTQMFTRISIAVLILAMGCSKNESQITPQPVPASLSTPPRAQFSAVATDMRAPVKVQFNNTSTNADSYTWEFGDGTFSNEKNPAKTFEESKLYSVKLTAVGRGGSNSTTIPVGVNPKPTRLTVKKISILNANLGGYDGPLDGVDPDVYVHVPGQSSLMATSVVNNARSVSSLVWNVNWEFDLNRRIFFDMIVADMDSNGDSVMGGVGIVISDYMTLNNHYPKEITKTEDGITIRLNVEWN